MAFNKDVLLWSSDFLNVRGTGAHTSRDYKMQLLLEGSGSRWGLYFLDLGRKSAIQDLWISTSLEKTSSHVASCRSISQAGVVGCSYLLRNGGGGRDGRPLLQETTHVEHSYNTHQSNFSSKAEATTLPKTTLGIRTVSRFRNQIKPRASCR